MKFFQWLKQTIFKKNLTEKAEAKQMSDDEWKDIANDYEAENAGRNFWDDLSAALQERTETASKHEQERTAVLNIINGLVPENTPVSSDDTETDDQPGNNSNLVEAMQRLATAYEAMAAQAREDRAEDEVVLPVNLNGPGTNATHFLGITHEMYSRKSRWNEIAANPSYAIQNPSPTKEDIKAFNRGFENYGESLRQRYAYLHANNRLDPKLLSDFTNDYSGLDNAKLGDYYLIRRQDALIARLITFYNVYNIFPRRYGVQDRDIMFSAFFDQVSQAWQEGEVFKGGMELQPELAYVDDAMIKMRFRPMKEIERMFIGYLNTEGSDPMKWSIYEWQMLNIMTQAISEQNNRRIRGIYVAPEDGVPGHYLNSSTGLIYTLFRYTRENKLKVHDDVAYIGYTDSTFLSTVQDLLRQIKLDVVEDDTVNFDNMVVHLNSNHKEWWKTNCRAQFGKDLDFSGPDSMVNKVPDIDTPIVWVQNMGHIPLILLQEPGNLQAIEFLPGEMLALQFEKRMEAYLGWSVWKEGFSASFVGKQFMDKTSMDANNFLYQRIFMNKPAILLADGATTADATKGFWFVSQENTAATAITDITGARKGVGYILEVGDVNNPPTIAQTGKFSEITAAFNPTMVGDSILLVLNTTGDKFLELERTEGGVRKINKLLQPNIPGAR